MNDRQDHEPILAQDRPVMQEVPFQVHFSDEARAWLSDNDLSLIFSTYTLGKVIALGPGSEGNLSACERNFGRAMALSPTPNGFYLSTLFQVWRFEHSLDPGAKIEAWDKLYLPRSCHVTGDVDVHDLHQTSSGELVAAITQYNCLANLDHRGSFNPVWRPPFVDKIVGEDRCHLNGFCLDGDEIAYVSAVSETNEAGKWYDRRADGGVILDARTNEVVCRGLSMPHTPRLHEGKLWLVEAGRGRLGIVDTATGKFEDICFCPGFLRGLRFYDKYALLGMSLPRNNVFAGLPLDEIIKDKGMEPECAIYGIDLETGKVAFTIKITGSVTEIYDLIVIEKTRQPLIIGLETDEIVRFIYMGADSSRTSA